MYEGASEPLGSDNDKQGFFLNGIVQTHTKRGIILTWGTDS